jgi:hypothetical protein
MVERAAPAAELLESNTPRVGVTSALPGRDGRHVVRVDRLRSAAVVAVAGWVIADPVVEPVLDPAAVRAAQAHALPLRVGDVAVTLPGRAAAIG